MSTFVNAAPVVDFQGVQDNSERALVPEAQSVPTHLPIWFIWAKKGPTDKSQLVVGDSRTQMYGADSFDPTSAWANHTTVYANTSNAAGNAGVYKRLTPSDAGPPASIRLYLDVLPTTVPEYARGSDGNYTLDSDGNKIPTQTTHSGYKIKWVADWVRPNNGGDDTFGVATQAAGDQVDSATSTTSIRYPILDLRAPYFGSDGNNYGLQIWAPTNNSSIVLDDRLVTDAKVYPFRLACVYRPNALTTPSVVVNQNGEQYVEATFKPNTIDPNTTARLSLGDVFLQAYQDFDSVNTPDVYGPFGQMHIYQNNIDTLLANFYSVEFPIKGDFSDFTGDANAALDLTEKYRFNLVSLVSSQNVPYHGVVLVNSGNFVRLSENSNMYAAGGSDGTMTDAAHAALVSAELAAYADENSEVMDGARHPESFLWDSGFPLATKYDLLNFISVRKDTAVVLSTHDNNGVELTATQDRSMATALKTRAQNFPESSNFNTPVMRAAIFGRSGRLLNTTYTKTPRLPVSLEVLAKASAYMGASDGKWISGKAFDVNPLNLVTMFADINVTYTSPKVRNKDWDAGLNWVQSFDLKSNFFPAFKTVYEDDTSVLTSFFTMAACVELEKIGERTWRKFTGRSNLTRAQKIDRVNKDILAQVKDKFDNRFVIVPTTYYTEADEARGYSWSTKITIYAPNMETVNTLSLEARRISDLSTNGG